jgi:glycyl-tRNA synthetase
MDHIVSLCKRRGFIFPSSEIYGGFAATYDYGPLGVLLKNNIKDIWWNLLVRNHTNIVGLDSAIFSHPRTWEASGHVQSFTDPLVEDKVTHERLRADHIIEDYCEEKQIDPKELAQKHLNKELELSELTVQEMGTILAKEQIKSPKGNDLTAPKVFNLLVEAQLGSTEETKHSIYLRGETCQAIFLQYKNILTSMRMKIPFGVAQVGKAFRNEITTKQFTLRTREFEQMEFEYFVDPDESFDAYDRWEEFFTKTFLENSLSIPKADIRLREIPPAERSHYAKRQKDFEVQLSEGKWLECSPMNHRGDWDLSRHGEFSGTSFTYTDEKTGKSFVPNVIETSFGVDRLVYIVLDKAYTEETVKEGDTRTVLKLPYALAPIKVAVFPLVKNKPDIVDKAHEIYAMLHPHMMCDFDDNGNIGKRYRRQDEIGTPYCVTIDYDTLQDETVTVRMRDSMKQERVPISQLRTFVTDSHLL